MVFKFIMTEIPYTIIDVIIQEMRPLYLTYTKKIEENYDKYKLNYKGNEISIILLNDFPA